MGSPSNSEIGIVSPSSPVSSVELALGVERLRAEGFSVQVHPQCYRKHLFFAGTDEERAQAIFDFAMNDRIGAIWSARGGYGAARILPILDQLASKKGKPRRNKLFVGYSDSTALMDFVRDRWGWKTLHAPMPGLRAFLLLSKSELKPLASWVRREEVLAPWAKRRLKFIGKRPKRAVRGEMIGGNLCVWASLLGTSYAPRARGKILFLEDVDESLYRIDRMVQQMAQAGGFEKVKGIVLGTFNDCRDPVAKVLSSIPPMRSDGTRDLESITDQELVPLRARLTTRQGLQKIFGPLGEHYGIPVAYGLPVGHGEGGQVPLPLGAEYRLSPLGTLEMLNWDWVD